MRQVAVWRCSLLWAVVSVGLGAFGSVVVAQPETLTDTSMGYTFRVPVGWVPFPTEEIDRLNALGKDFGLSRSPYVYGYIKLDVPDDKAVYLLIQHGPGRLSGMSYEQLEQSFGAISESSVERLFRERGMEAQLDLGRITLDREQNRILINGSMINPESGERMRGRSVIFLGADGMVSLYCYASEDIFDEQRLLFDFIADGFSWQNGRAFVPGAGRSSLIAKAVVGAILGGFAMLVVLLLRVLSSPRRKKSSD